VVVGCRKCPAAVVHRTVDLVVVVHRTVDLVVVVHRTVDFVVVVHSSADLVAVVRMKVVGHRTVAWLQAVHGLVAGRKDSVHTVGPDRVDSVVRIAVVGHSAVC
jgi:hypothetical protein